MRIVGIICEYNPLHRGHLRQIAFCPPACRCRSLHSIRLVWPSVENSPLQILVHARQMGV